MRGKFSRGVKRFQGVNRGLGLGLRRRDPDRNRTQQEHACNTIANVTRSGGRKDCPTKSRIWLSTLLLGTPYPIISTNTSEGKTSRHVCSDLSLGPLDLMKNF